MVFIFVFLLVGCSIFAYNLYTAPDVDTCLSKELVAFEFKDLKFK